MKYSADLWERIIRDRIALASRGIQPPKLRGKPLRNFSGPGYGAGPQGKTFHMRYPEQGYPARMISVPVYPEEHHLASYAVKTKISSIAGAIETENGIILGGAKMPKFVNKTLPNGSLFYQEGRIMVHCYNTAVSVMGFGCRHFDNSEECIYCELDPVGRQLRGYDRCHDANHFAEMIEFATQSDDLPSLSITSGTFDEPDVVAKQYLRQLQAIREKSSIPIHIQMEPLEDISIYPALAEYAQTIGIFLEMYDEGLRKQICPGKGRNSVEKYMKNWEAAVKAFGRGNVLSISLLGFGEDYDRVLSSIDRFAEIGVTTTLLFIRSRSKHMKNFIPSYLEKSEDELFDFFIEAAKIQAKHGVQPKVSKKAGCIGCLGCSAITEASLYLEALNGKN